jgi:hypothetical protein
MSREQETVSKAELGAEICALVGIEDPGLSTGSTERKELFLAATDLLALGLSDKSTKPELARAIVEAAGFVWRPDYESRGSTVTRLGMTAVRDALRFLLG